MWFHTSPHPSASSSHLGDPIILLGSLPQQPLYGAGWGLVLWQCCLGDQQGVVHLVASKVEGGHTCKISGDATCWTCWCCHFLCRNRQKPVKIHGSPLETFQSLQKYRTSHRPISPRYGSHQGIVPGFPDPNIRCLESPNQKRPHRPWMQEPVPWQDDLAPWSPLDPSYLPCKAWRTPIACSRSSDSSGRDPCQKRKWTWAALESQAARHHQWRTKEFVLCDKFLRSRFCIYRCARVS